MFFADLAVLRRAQCPSNVWVCSRLFPALIHAIHSQGQTTNGLITGSVTDSTGATVPGAVVTVTNPATGVPRTATSNESGTYVVPQLAPGNYDISVKKQGFATEKRADLQLEVNQSVTLDFKLGVASAAQTVEVTGAAPSLNTTYYHVNGCDWTPGNGEIVRSMEESSRSLRC